MKKILFLIVAAFVSGCLRGESKSLGEIYANAKSEFEALNTKGLAEDASKHLNDTTASLKNLEGAVDSSKAGEAAKEVAKNLSTLISQAGVTARPAMTELRNQFLALSEEKNLTSAQLKLLGSRTYSLLTEEVRTTKFGS